MQWHDMVYCDGMREEVHTRQVTGSTVFYPTEKIRMSGEGIKCKLGTISAVVEMRLLSRLSLWGVLISSISRADCFFCALLYMS